MKKNALLLLLFSALCVSCTTTSVYWVPVYTMSGGAQGKSAFDPATKTIADAQEGATYAYYIGENKQAIVYSNPYSLSLSRKIVLSNNVLDASQSTAEPTSNLVLSKHFLYDPTEKVPNNAADLLAAAGIDYKNAGLFKTPADVYRDHLYITKGDTLVAFDQRLVKDGQELEYVISGKNLGSDNLASVVVLDDLAPGFDLVDTGYWFSSQESSSTATTTGPGLFEHKIVTNGNRTSLVFIGTFKTPFKPGDEFRIKVKVKLNFGTLHEEFSSGGPS